MAAAKISSVAAGLWILALLSIGGACFELHESNLAHQAVVSAHSAFSSERRELPRRAPLKATTTAFQSVSGGIAGSNGGATDIAAQLAAGHRFLATEPRAAALVESIARAMASSIFGPFFKNAGLTSDQVQRFEDAFVQARLNGVLLGADGSLRYSQPFPDAAALTAILGAQGYQQFNEFVRVMPAMTFATQVGIASGYAGAPLSSEQTDQLAGIIAEASPSYQNLGRVAPADINWNAVLSAAPSVLSSEQLRAGLSAFYRFRYQQALSAALTAKGN